MSAPGQARSSASPTRCHRVLNGRLYTCRTIWELSFRMVLFRRSSSRSVCFSDYASVSLECLVGEMNPPGRGRLVLAFNLPITRKPPFVQTVVSLCFSAESGGLSAGAGRILVYISLFNHLCVHLISHRVIRSA